MNIFSRALPLTLSDAVKSWSNAGGGGERVLWTAIAALQRTDPDVLSVIYTGDIDNSKEGIIAKVKVNCSYYQSVKHLNMFVRRDLIFPWIQDHSILSFFIHDILLKTLRGHISPSLAKALGLCTLLGRLCRNWFRIYISVSDNRPHSIRMRNFYKAHLIDTMGYAFTFHVVILLGRIPVGAYVHYPTISTDMLARVKSRTKWHTNTDEISSSTTLSHAKLLWDLIPIFNL